jgi:ethanolaminephosphotransferase
MKNRSASTLHKESNGADKKDVPPHAHLATNTLLDDKKNSFMQLTPYLGKTACENLPKYVYRAGDTSPSTKYFWNPVAAYLVTLLPMTLAANCVTCLGFVFSITPMILLMVQFGTQMSNPTKESLPGWIFSLQSVFYFTYRMLDEMDGKQARRTKMGSPLGMMFDHGLDAYSVGFMLSFFVKICQIGETPQAVLVPILGNFVFHLTTLEQYYTGEIVLGSGNFITDGTFVVCPSFFLMAYYGNNFWLDVPVESWGIKTNQLFLYVYYAAFVGNALER